MIYCRNLSNNLGRKEFTSLLNTRIKFINYPEKEKSIKNDFHSLVKI